MQTTSCQGLRSSLAATLLLAAAALTPAYGQPPGAPGPPGGGPAARTVTVDCDRGDTVAAALATPAQELTVLIHGVCHEDVVVARDRVTLRGRDPATDGLRGVSASAEPPNAVVRIEGAHQIRLERLSIADGARNGVEVLGSQAITVEGCVIRDHGRDGLQVVDNSFATVTGTEIRDNARAGVTGWDTGLLSCTGCVVTGNRLAVISVYASGLGFEASTLDATQSGVLAANGGQVLLRAGTTVAGPSWALGADSNGSISAFDTTLDGNLFAENASHVRLERVTQPSAPSAFGAVTGNSTLQAIDSSLVNPLLVSSFSNLVLDGTTSGGPIVCEQGGDAWCSDPALVTGGTSGCGLCVAP